MTIGTAKKVTISEEDVSLLLQRYNPTIIITLLQEISQVAGIKIDWNALVKRTATGITSAREYQMLWRHLAYRHALLEKIEDGTEPLDDESDLEIELEAVPTPSDEALSEAAACVKVLMSSGPPREQGLSNRTNAEAPLTLNGFNDPTLRVSSDKQQLSRANRGTNFPAPTLQKQSLPTGTSAEGLDGNGSLISSFPPKKKRKLWTKEEDMELIAAVQKFGEGNWANILKGEFKHNRTASQLSQRWAIIRKRDANLLQGSGNKSTSTTRSEERLATQKAISLALDMPKSGRLSAILSGGTQAIATSSASALSAAPSEVLPVSNQPLNQLQQASIVATSQKTNLNTLNKSRANATSKKSLVSVKPSTGPNSLIQAAAFAAGGRIATPSTAASLFKAAQSKNAVHIRPGGAARSSPINNIKPLVTIANTTSLQPVSAKFNKPSVSTVAPSSSTPVSTSGTNHGGRQLQECSGNSANNPLNAVPTNPHAMLESNSDTTSHEMAERSDVDISPIDVDELLAEEVKCVDEMELDDIMAEEHQTSLLTLDTSANEDNDFANAYDTEATIDKQMDLPTTIINENRNVDSKIVSCDAEAAENNAVDVISNHPILAEKATPSFNGESDKIPPVDNNQIDPLNQERLTGVQVVAEEVNSSIEDKQAMLPEDAPLSSQTQIDDPSIITNEKPAELVG